MMRTEGKMRVIWSRDENPAISMARYRVIVGVEDCRNIDDSGEVIFEDDFALYEIYSSNPTRALEEIAEGAGNYLGPDLSDIVPGFEVWEDDLGRWCVYNEDSPYSRESDHQVFGNLWDAIEYAMQK